MANALHLSSSLRAVGETQRVASDPQYADESGPVRTPQSVDATALTGGDRADDLGDVGRSELGRRLHQARLQSKLSLAEVADHIRVKPDHLHALETGAFDKLPGRAYAIGFLKAYAEFLGLSISDCVARYKAEAGEPAPVRVDPMGFPEPVAAPRSQNGGSLLLVAIILFLGVFVGWRITQPADVTEIDVATQPPTVSRLAGEPKNRRDETVSLTPAPIVTAAPAGPVPPEGEGALASLRLDSRTGLFQSNTPVEPDVAAPAPEAVRIQPVENPADVSVAAARPRVAADAVERSSERPSETLAANSADFEAANTPSSDTADVASTGAEIELVAAETPIAEPAPRTEVASLAVEDPLTEELLSDPAPAFDPDVQAAIEQGRAELSGTETTESAFDPNPPAEIALGRGRPTREVAETAEAVEATEELDPIEAAIQNGLAALAAEAQTPEVAEPELAQGEVAQSEIAENAIEPANAAETASSNPVPPSDRTEAASASEEAVPAQEDAELELASVAPEVAGAAEPATQAEPAAVNSDPETVEAAASSSEPARQAPSLPDGAAYGADAVGRVVVRAVIPGYLQIVDADGAELFAQRVNAGDVFNVPDGANAQVSVVNAGGFDVIVDGDYMGRLGRLGERKSDFSLDAERLKNTLQ